MRIFRTSCLIAVCAAAFVVGLGSRANAETGWVAESDDESGTSVGSRAVRQAEQAEAEAERAEYGEKAESHIETDRDSFTPSTRTVEYEKTIIEAAYSFIDNRGAADTHSFPEFITRMGIGEGLELRLGWNYEVGGGSGVVSGVEGAEGLEGPTVERESRLLYGLKVRLSDQEAWLPESSFIVQGFTPTSGDATATDVAATYVIGWEMRDRWKLDAALRYGTVTEQNDTAASWAPSVVLRVPVGERWNAHVEYFGMYPQGMAGAAPEHYISPGLHYLVNHDLEVGFRVGWGLNDPSARFFVNAGVGWRF